MTIKFVEFKDRSGGYVAVNPRTVVLIEPTKVITSHGTTVLMTNIRCHGGYSVTLDAKPFEVTTLFNSQP